MTEAQVNPGSQDLFSQQTYISDPSHEGNNMFLSF